VAVGKIKKIKNAGCERWLLKLISFLKDKTTKKYREQYFVVICPSS